MHDRFSLWYISRRHEQVRPDYTIRRILFQFEDAEAIPPRDCGRGAESDDGSDRGIANAVESRVRIECAVPGNSVGAARIPCRLVRAWSSAVSATDHRILPSW